MKNKVRFLTAALLLISTNTLAAQFEVYVAQPANESASTSEFSALLQKRILIDTSTSTIRLPKLRACAIESICQESIHWSNYQITKTTYDNRSPSLLMAVLGSSQILITSTPDHSTLIEIVNSKGSVEARFIGSPIQSTRFLN
jgi:hypothetical protein